MKKYGLKNTIEEVRSEHSIQPYLDILYPVGLYSFIPAELMDKPLTDVAKKVMFPWGLPFDPSDFLRAVRIAQKIAYEHAYRLIPLWREGEAEFVPNASRSSKENVFLMTENRKNRNRRPAAVICPGGSYETLAFDQEGIKMAEVLEEADYCAFVLNYRVSPNRYPAAQHDLLLAIKHLRIHAEEYGIDPDRILAVGSSAGGHLCASTAYLYRELDESLDREIQESGRSDREKYHGVSGRPDGICLNYPVISFITEQHEQSFQALTGGKESLRAKLSVELHVENDYPKTFVWTCDDDSLVPPSNAKRFGQALKEHGVESVLEIYPQGEHGCGLGTGTSAEGWIDKMLEFMKD